MELSYQLIVFYRGSTVLSTAISNLYFSCFGTTYDPSGSAEPVSFGWLTSNHLDVSDCSRPIVPFTNQKYFMSWHNEVTIA